MAPVHGVRAALHSKVVTGMHASFATTSRRGGPVRDMICRSMCVARTPMTSLCAEVFGNIYPCPALTHERCSLRPSPCAALLKNVVRNFQQLSKGVAIVAKRKSVSEVLTVMKHALFKAVTIAAGGQDPDDCNQVRYLEP